MSAKTIKAAEFKAKCLDLMDQVAASGESIVITKRGKPVAKLAPVTETAGALFGVFKGKIEYDDDDDLIAPVELDWGPAEPVLRPRAKRRP